MAKKVGSNSVGDVFKEFRRPLEELAKYPGVQKVSPAESFHKRGKENGFKVGAYDSTRHSLQLICNLTSAGQVTYLTVSPENLPEVRRHIATLNAKYFGIPFCQSPL